MRASTSRESVAMRSILLLALAARGESSRVPREAAEVDSVDQEVPENRREEVPPPHHQAAEEETGERREQGPEAERAPRAAVQEGEEDRRRDEPPLPLHRAAEEQLLGEAGE